MSNEKGVIAPKAAGAVVPPPLFFLGGFIVGVVINIFIPISISRSIWVQLFGFVPLVLGAWLISSAMITFKRHKTPAEPWKSSTELVQDGPYHYSRNPIYLSFALIYVGLSFVLNSALALIILIPLLVIFDHTQVPHEERYLKEKFGEEFDHYKATVRRWI